MTISGNAYTVEQIDRAVKRAFEAIGNLPNEYVNPALMDKLISLYLGAIDADKDDQTGDPDK